MQTKHKLYAFLYVNLHSLTLPSQDVTSWGSFSVLSIYIQVQQTSELQINHETEVDFSRLTMQQEKCRGYDARIFVSEKKELMIQGYLKLMIAVRSAECLNEREEGGWFMLLQMWEPDDDEDAFAMASCKSPARRVINVLRRFIKRKVICKKICKINRYNKLLLKYIIVSAYCF